MREMELDGKKIRSRRRIIGMSQEELSTRLGGLTKAIVSAWELGSRPVPPKHNDKICQILNVQPEELCSEIPVSRIKPFSRKGQIDIERLNFIRKSKDISQEELAKRLGLQKPNVSNWERGTKEIPIKYREKICQILNVQLEDLMSDALPEPVPVVKQPWHLPEPMHQELQAETQRLGQIVWADLRVEVEKVLSCFIANKELYGEALLALSSGRHELPEKIIAELYVKFSKVALQMCGEKILDGIKTRKVETKITWER